MEINDHLAALARGATDAAAAVPVVSGWARRLHELYGAGGRLLICGNGGSAAQAQHLSAELVGKFDRDREPMSAIALHTDGSAVTAISNDYGDEYVFARQVRAHARPGDVLLALSTSGESRNVVTAVKTAQELDITTWALTGSAPNTLASAADESIAVDGRTATVQEIHLALIHSLCLALDNELGV